ncbi:MAG: hypothetical protein WCK75_11245 [Elusimicrobiota bacterium]
MAAAKKYKVRVRLKVRNRLLKTAGIAFSSLAVVVILGYTGLSAARFVSSLTLGRFFSFTLKAVSVASPSDEISAEISSRLSRYMGRAFSAGDSLAFVAALKQTYPALSGVKVDRNFVNGRIIVRAESERVVAKVRLNGGNNFYLSDNGRLLEENYGSEPADIFETDLYAVSGSGLVPLAGFLTEMKAMTPELLSRPVKLECRGAAQVCLLTLENSAEVLWGEFAFTKTKISRLNEVLADAARKIKGPLKVDFRYFRDGKIFVSKLPDI